MRRRRSKPVRAWGSFVVQVRGAKKWTTLRRDHYYWGAGYDLTKERARELAEESARTLRGLHPDRAYRVEGE